MSKNVLITGGAGGIGSSIAQKFIANGYDVYSVDLISADLGKNFHNEIVDVTSLEQLFKLKEKLRGVKFDHIITLAGRAVDGEWEDFKNIDATLIEKSVRLNLTGHINVIKVFYDALSEAPERSCVTVSSINAFGGFGLPIYSAAKAGLIGFTRTVFDQMAKDGVRINTVCFGTVVTPATEKEPKDFSELLKLTKNGRFVTREEAAEEVYALCVLKTDVTGAVIVKDEGQMEKANVKPAW